MADFDDFGGVCYASCIFHVLARSPEFMQKLEETGRNFKEEDGHSVTGVLYWILKEILRYDPVRTDKVREGDPLRGNTDLQCFMDALFKLDTTFQKHLQNDCHSFLISVLKIITRDNKMFDKNPTAIFEGTFQNQFQYTTCDHIEYSGDETFLTLLVPTYDHDEKPKPVQEGLHHILGEEVFDCDTLICRVCEKPKQDTFATKKMEMIKPPDILILQLARFKEVRHEVDQRKLVKEESPVNFEEILHLDKEKQQKYSLYGVVIHLGNIDEGHYVTYVKSTTEHGRNSWLHCNGWEVSRCERQVVFDWIKSSAYVLFYHRMK